MSVIMSRSGQFDKSEIKLNFIEIAWEKLMNERLLSTKIFKDSKIDFEECLRFDQDFVMDVRHKMVHSEALKILRIENHNRMLQKKENKMIEKEITKLKQILEDDRILAKKEIEKTTSKKTKSLSDMPKLPKYYQNVPKRLEYYDIIYKINDCHNQYVHMTTETKNSQQKIPVDTKEHLKKNKQKKEILKPIFNLNNRIVQFDTKNEKYIMEVVEGNNEIMKTFFEKDTKELEQDSLNDIEEKFIIKKEIEMQNRINQKILECAWRTWKAYAQRLKNRKREKTIYTCKIESFLSYLQEKEIRQEKARNLKRKMSVKYERKANLILENRLKIRGQQTTKEEKEEKLKRLTEEIKASQAGTKKKLQEIMKTNSKNEGKFSNHKFLQKIEKRRQERLKRRKEIQEKKLKFEEEKKKIQMMEEEEKELKEKQTRVEELKRKRRLEKEKKLLQEQKREKLKLAENHYETYLIRKCGWKPWKMLLKIRDSQYQYAVAFYEKRVTQMVFRKWMAHVKEYVEIITARAEMFYKSTLKKKSLLIWKKFLERKKNQDQAAADWNEFKITERAFKKWLQFTQHEILEYLNKKEIVELFYERKLKTKSLKKIRAYPEFRKLEQAKEVRKRMWRQKIKEILPDYQPVYVLE